MTIAWNRWVNAQRAGIALAAVVISAALALPAWAVPANGRVWTFTQPDGHQFQAVLRGDEFHAYHETPDGQILLQDPASGFWHYARPRADGSLEATDAVVGQSAVETKALNPEKAQWLAAVERAVTQKMQERMAERSPARVAATGTIKAVMLLANFSDTTTQFTATDMTNLFNTTGYNQNGADGSVRDYYLEASYGALTVQTDVYGWFNLSHTKAYYGANDSYGYDLRPREMVIDTVTASQATVDYSQYDVDGDGWVDFFGVIHQGQGEEQGGTATADCIWSHSWSLATPLTVDGVKISDYHTEPELLCLHLTTISTQLTTIGVMCHEMGHVFGLPDLYDTTYASEGVGMWSIMAGGSWAGPDNDGSKPVHFDPWSKIALGWIVPTEVRSIQTASMPAFYANADSVLKIPVDPYDDGEYFLVCNRYAQNTGQPATGFDQYCPGSGALVLHVDDYVPDNDTVAHKKVDVEEADGLAQLDSGTNQGNAGDLYPTGATAFNDASNPNSRSYSGGSTGIALSGFTGAGTANMTVNVAPRTSVGASIFYDAMGASGLSLGYDDGNSDFGMVRFTAPEDGTIWRVKTYFTYSGTTNYTVRVYSGLASGMPTGLLASQSGTHAGTGYGSLAFATRPTMAAGADFYVEVEYNTGGSYGYPVPTTSDTVSDERGYMRGSSTLAYEQLLVADGLPQDVNIRVDYVPIAPTAPAVDNAPASGVTNTSATLNGSLTSVGSQNPDVHIFWGAADGGTSRTAWANDIGLGTRSVGSFAATVTGLDAGCTYYYRAYAANSAGAAWASATANFATDAGVTAPAVANASATSRTATSAVLNAAVTGTGGEAPTVHIYWGTTDGGMVPGDWSHDANLGTHGLGAVWTAISSLTTSATYYYRASATNSAGTAWAAESGSFVARDIVPATVVDADATSVTRTTARLNGAVLDSGGATPSITVFYGTADGGSTPSAWAASVEVGAVDSGAFFADVSGLAVNTVYFFRARAVNSVGTAWAAASTAFTTLPDPLATPAGLTATKGTATDRVTVTWPAVPAAGAYRVFRAASASATPEAVTGWTAATSYDDTDVVLSALYYYRVQAARDLAGTDPSPLGNTDSGWIAMTGQATNFRITYKNCTLTIVNNSIVRVDNALMASIKVDRLDKMPARAKTIPGKLVYMTSSAGIPRFDVTGSVAKFSTAAPIGELSATGAINSLSTLGVAIPTVTAGTLGSVKMTAYALGDSASQRALTSFYAGDVASTGTLAVGAPAIKMALTGVSLREFRAPSQTAQISLASKKWRNPSGFSDLSLAEAILDGSNVVEAGSLTLLATKGGAIAPARILGSASAGDASVVSGTGLAFSGSSGVRVYAGTVAPGEIVSGAAELTVASKAGSVQSPRIVAAGTIALLSAQHQAFRTPSGTVNAGGAVGLDVTSTTMHVVSGTETTASERGMAKIYGSVSVNGDFYAGGDGTLGTLFGGAIGEIGTAKAGAYPVHPEIRGSGWSSGAIEFTNGDHSGFVEHNP